jgi:hypothetical protein
MGTPILPILRLQEAARSSIPLDAGAKTARPAVRLRRGPFRDRPEIWSLIPLDDAVPLAQQKNLFAEAEDWLAAEMERCSAEPRIIRIDANAPFGPDMAQIIETVARLKIVAWVTTNQPLPADVIEALAKHEDFVRVTVTLPTLEPAVSKAVEPEGALPAERLALIASLVEMGITVDVALEPLLPGLTDSPNHLQALLQSLTGLGISQVTAGYLVLHDREADRLQAALQPPEAAEVVLTSYADGVVLRDGGATAHYVPKARRQRGYAALIALGAALGIEVRVSALSNPDFRPARDEVPHHVRSLQQSFRERALGA